MSVAAQEASMLGECLAAGDEADLPQRFFKAVERVVDVPWDITVGNDLRHPQVVGARPAKVRFINWYIGKLHKAARHDAKVAAAFLEVANLKAAPERLLHPAVVGRVISGNLLHGGARAPAAQASAQV
jgi:hypothetical protein